MATGAAVDNKAAILNHFGGDFIPFYLRHLPEVKPIGRDEWAAACPFHQDTEPSLNFNAKTGCFYCHGCQTKGDVFSFYGRLHGLSNGDFPKVLEGIAGDFGIALSNGHQADQEILKSGRIVATYDYHDEAGGLLFQVCRMEPKSFRQRRPDGKGGWIWNLKDFDPVLYNLPKLRKVDEVFFVEGEKDADALLEQGFDATTNPMGAGKWRDSYTEALRGKKVILLPDNDEPGREHMLHIAGELHGKAESIKIINLPGLPDKGDVSDFIALHENPEAGGEALYVLAHHAPLWEPEKTGKPTVADAIIELRDFRRLPIKPRVSYLDPWLKEDAIILVSGWRGCGKTFFALGVLDAISNGQTFGPWECEQPAACMLLDGEMPPADIIERSDLMNLDRDRVKPLFIYSDYHANQLGLPRANLNDESWRGAVAEILVARGIRVWVVDNLASLAPGLDENSRQDWDPINQWLLQLRFAGITTLMLHHTGKAGMQRGTSSREDNIDCSIILKSPPDYTPDEGARFIVTFSKARVSTKGLGLIQDMEFRLQPDDDGRLVWTYGIVKHEARRQILNLLDEGMNQADIAKELEISKGQVSKVRSKAIKDGWMTEKNKLTMTGYSAVSSGNFGGNSC